MWNYGILLPLVCLIHTVPVSVMTVSTTSRTRSLRVLQSCNFDVDCPVDASCRVRNPDGPLCICNKGFMASRNLIVCEKAAFFNQTCMTRCAGLFMLCEPRTRRCVCGTGYVPAMDGINCALEGKGLLSEACGDGCVFDGEQNCIDGVCRCFPDLRPFTSDEIQAFNSPLRQCLNKTYRLVRSSWMTVTITTTRTLSPRVLQPCEVDSDCPLDASCRVRNPDGPLCICNKGFIASANLTVCEKAAFYNETCVTRCAGLFLSCEPTTRRCVCTTGYVPAMDGISCALEGKGLLDEACGDMGCLLDGEQNCTDGVCRCFSNLRPLTSDESQAFNNPQRQCVTETYRLGTPPPPSPITGASPGSLMSTSVGVSETEPDSTSLIIGVAIGFGSAVLLSVIIIPVICIMRRRHSRDKNQNEATGQTAKSNEVGVASERQQTSMSDDYSHVNTHDTTGTSVYMALNHDAIYVNGQ